jgi:tetratricopeptide (TPR) repeat protein
MPASSPSDISAQFRVADDAIARGDLAGARIAYRSVLASDNLSHANALRVAEGLYRARDFSGVVSAFTRAGAISRGEEPYRYYLAVALYETGQYAAAKRELMAVIPFIEVTADVARYDAKIRAAIE